MLVDVLGQSLLDRTVSKLRDFGASQPKVISEGASAAQVLPRSEKSGGFVAEWENAVAAQLQQEIELLLLVRMSGYHDLDYRELIQFHKDRGGPLTQAYGTNGSLDVAVVDSSWLRAAGAPYRLALSSLIPHQQKFFFSGYTNSLSRPQDFRRLVEDGLKGRCGVYPVGTEVRAQVWYGHGAHVDRSAVIQAPAFIGAGSHIAASCEVTGASAIERNCEIDCGSAVDSSCILQNSYVGVALDIRGAIVSNAKLFHLDRDVEVGFTDPSLIGVTRAMPFLRGRSNALWSPRQRAD